MAQLLKDIKAAIGHTDPMRAGLIDRFMDGSESKVLRRLNFVTDPKIILAMNYNQRDRLPAMSERSVSENYPENAGSGTSRKTVNLAIFGGEVRTDMIYVDADAKARQMEIEAAMISAGKRFEKQFFHGDSSVNAKQFDGLRRRCTVRNRVSYAGTDGGAITKALLDEALDRVTGANSNKTLYMHRRVRRALTTVLVATAGGKGVSEAQMQLESYNGAAIETIEEDETYADIFQANETRGNSAVTESVYVVRHGTSADREFVQGVHGNTFMKHRDVGVMGTYYLDVIDNVVGIEDFNPHSIWRIAGILA